MTKDLKPTTELQAEAGDAMLRWRVSQRRADEAKQAAKKAARAAIEEEAVKFENDPLGFKVMDAHMIFDAIGSVDDFEPTVLRIHNNLRDLMVERGYSPPVMTTKGPGGGGR